MKIDFSKLEEAALIAFEQKDLDGLHDVQQKCINKPAILKTVNTFIAQLNTKK